MSEPSMMAPLTFDGVEEQGGLPQLSEADDLRADPHIIDRGRIRPAGCELARCCRQAGPSPIAFRPPGYGR
jgi:hypothetical protein